MYKKKFIEIFLLTIHIVIKLLIIYLYVIYKFIYMQLPPKKEKKTSHFNETLKELRNGGKTQNEKTLTLNLKSFSSLRSKEVLESWALLFLTYQK